MIIQISHKTIIFYEDHIYDNTNLLLECATSAMYTVGDGKATQLSFFNKGKTFSISFITQRLRCGPSTLNKPLSKCTFRPRAIFYSLKSFYRVNYTSQYMIEV